MQGQVLNRLVDARTHTALQTVFDIEPEQFSLLRGDLVLHVGATAVMANGARAYYHRDAGGYSMISEIRMTVRSTGQTLYHLKNAHWWGNFRQLGLSENNSGDVEYGLSHCRRRMSILPTGLFTRDRPAIPLTTNAATTPMVALSLNRLVPFLGSGAFPITHTGALRIQILWNTSAAIALNSATDVTSWTPTTPQLAYSLLQAPELIMALPKQIPLQISHPVAVSNYMDDTATAPSLNCGGAGLRVSRAVFAFFANTNTLSLSIPAAETIQFRVNSRDMFSERLTESSLMNTLNQTWGPIQLPPSSYVQMGGNLCPGDMTGLASHWYALDLRPVRTAPPSVANSTLIDANGIVFSLQCTAGTARYLRGWLMSESVVVV